ncbi:hypothetical protein H8S95_13675 [Pontibacter sp. KCTC 32443]|uniref:hypothetical protein n=1 Tax=Pontibacter TaxID=323449 RepID=UPI00164DFDE9|nr:MULTISPECIES: hypothetical protein [Pontibacter]MBC5775122.1 hypothetical protein [Pontibacter sp. KCTC 32443]
MSGQVVTCPYGSTLQEKLRANISLLTEAATIEMITGFGWSAFDLLRCRRQHEHSEGSFKSAARCPKTGPRGREGTKANYKTVGK